MGDLPLVFIGAAGERDRLVTALKAVLEEPPRRLLARSWRDVFRKAGANSTTIEVLVHAVSEYDYGVFLLSPEDVTFLRNQKVTTARGNVVLEFGLFLGAMGRDHTFAVIPDSFQTDTPSDLAGVHLYTWVEEETESPESAIRETAEKIKQLVVAGGRRPKPADSESRQSAISDSSATPGLLPPPAPPDAWREAAQAGLLRSPDVIAAEPGVWVVHPRYGLGRILDRGPGDEDAYATVQFAARHPAALRVSDLYLTQFAASDETKTMRTDRDQLS